MSNIVIFFFFCAFITIVILAFYAGRLFWLLRQQKLKQQQLLSKKILYLHDSILTISRAMHAGQCELSEGSLRLWVLFDHLPDQNKPDPVVTYPGLHQMYLIVKDMPTHKARQKQDKKLTRQQDKIRLQAEQDLKSLINTDTIKLIEYISGQKKNVS